MRARIRLNHFNMAFTDLEIAEHIKLLEDSFWFRRRLPLRLRDKLRQCQRLTDQSIAKVTYVRSKDVGCLFWKRADGKQHVVF
jgi:hypothetical protein